MNMFSSVYLSVIFVIVLSIDTTKSTLHSIVIEVKGDCQKFAQPIAQEHGYRYVRQVGFDCV